MSKSQPSNHLEVDICVHIFSVSAAMVGVCLTVIGIIRIVVGNEKIDTIADDLLASDAFLFATSCMLSYWALRTRSKVRMHRIERVADILFLTGLALMVFVSGLIVYAIA